MAQETIERYHTEINALAIKVYKDLIPLKTLLSAIESRRNDAAGDRTIDEFYQGEACFFEGQYDRALKHYLLATSTPNLPFYCYRATASLFLSQGNNDKALGFTQKALKVYPEDYPTLKVLEKLLLQSNQPEDLAEVQNKIKALEKEQDVDEQTPNKAEISTESPMNSGSDIFSFPKVEENVSNSTLTERLYPARSDRSTEDPFKPKREAAVLNELQKRAHSTPLWTSEDPIAKRLESFQFARAEILQTYIASSRENAALKEDALFFLSGYPSSDTQDEESLYLTESLRNPSKGFYLSRAGKGVVVNPGTHFLENFHAQGLTVRDIHFVVVTNDLPESSADVQSIYDLNYQINKGTQDIHIIHYYFSQKAFQELSKTLKPHFKQERDAIHHLELFIDSPEVEKVELSPEIVLHHFLVPSNLTSDVKGTNFGIKIELKSEDLETPPVSVGYLSDASWTPLLSSHLGHCDLLITGFGDTSPNDYNKITFNSGSLGYHGTANLLQDVSPQLLLCGEFNGGNGDVRLEIVQKLREESSGIGSTTILPADNGLVIDLRTLSVPCAITQEPTPVQQIRVVRNKDFGGLVYVAPACFC